MNSFLKVQWSVVSLRVLDERDSCVSGQIAVWKDHQGLGTDLVEFISVDQLTSDHRRGISTNRYTSQIDLYRYKCSKCTKSYSAKHYLTQHVKTCRGQEKTACCPHCSYKSNRRWNLKSHIRRIHAIVANKQINVTAPFLVKVETSP